MYKKIVTACLSLSLVVILINWSSLNSHHESIKSKNIIENTDFDKHKIIELIKEVQISTIKTEKAHVKIFDLSRELEPENIYRDIKCRKSAKFIIETTLCIHPVERDIWVSSSIWNYGVWEGDIVCKSKSILKNGILFNLKY
jgi:hypothetical protein